MFILPILFPELRKFIGENSVKLWFQGASQELPCAWTGHRGKIGFNRSKRSEMSNFPIEFSISIPLTIITTNVNKHKVNLLPCRFQTILMETKCKTDLTNQISSLKSATTVKQFHWHLLNYLAIKRWRKKNKRTVNGYWGMAKLGWRCEEFSPRDYCCAWAHLSKPNDNII